MSFILLSVILVTVALPHSNVLYIGQISYAKNQKWVFQFNLFLQFFPKFLILVVVLMPFLFFQFNLVLWLLLPFLSLPLDFIIQLGPIF
jgi:hypothetical protein